jgi:hypothetical protein
MHLTKCIDAVENIESFWRSHQFAAFICVKQ